MGTATAHPEPPQAIVVGTGRPALERVVHALAAAGYGVTVLSPDEDLEASATAQAAALAAIERGPGGDTAILTAFRRMGQRPALAIIEPAGVLLVAGFGSIAPGPYAPEALPALLREHLGLTAPAAAPAAPEAPAAAWPGTPEPAPKPEAPAAAWPGTPEATLKPEAPATAWPAPPEPAPVAGRRADLRPERDPRAAAAAQPGRSRWDLGLIGLLALALVTVGAFVVVSGLTSAPAPSVAPTAGLPSPLPSVTAVPIAPGEGTTARSPGPLATEALPAAYLDVEIVGLDPGEPRVGDVVNVQVRVRNLSGQTLTGPFWVDLYVSPVRTPAPQVPWSEIAAYGVTWRVSGLSPGESRDLYSLDADPARSNLLAFEAPGTHQLYVLADTFSELPADLSNGQARPTFLGGPAEVVVGYAPKQP